MVHLIVRASKEECDYLKLTLELAKTIIEKGLCIIIPVKIFDLLQLILGEALGLEMIQLGIVKHILEVQQLDLQQQALDLLVLLLGKGCCMELYDRPQS